MAQNFIDYCPNDFRVYPYDIAAQLVCQPATTRASTSNCVDVGEIVHMGIHKSPLGLPPWVMHLLSITTWQEDSFGVLVTQRYVVYYWEEESISCSATTAATTEVRCGSSWNVMGRAKMELLTILETGFRVMLGNLRISNSSWTFFTILFNKYYLLESSRLVDSIHTYHRWGSHDLRVGLIRLTSVPR